MLHKILRVSKNLQQPREHPETHREYSTLAWTDRPDVERERDHGLWRMPHLKILFSVCAALAFTLSSHARAQSGSASGTVVGFVTTGSAAQPVSFADVTVDRFGI